MARYGESTCFLENLEGAHEKIIDGIARATVSKQPYVMKLVLDALMEDSGADNVDLTDEDIGLLSCFLKPK